MTSIPKTGAPQLDSFVEEGDDDAADLLACLVLLGMLSIDGDDFGHGDAPSAREEIGRGRESGQLARAWCGGDALFSTAECALLKQRGGAGEGAGGRRPWSSCGEQCGVRCGAASVDSGRGGARARRLRVLLVLEVRGRGAGSTATCRSEDTAACRARRHGYRRKTMTICRKPPTSVSPFLISPLAQTYPI